MSNKANDMLSEVLIETYSYPGSKYEGEDLKRIYYRSMGSSRLILTQLGEKITHMKVYRHSIDLK